MPGQGHDTLFGQFRIAELRHASMPARIQRDMLAKTGKPPCFPHTAVGVGGCARGAARLPLVATTCAACHDSDAR